MTVTKEYREAKKKYYELIEKMRLHKSDVRALVGLKTWSFEQESWGKTKDSTENHITGFSEAVNYVGRLTEGKAEGELKKLLKVWQKKGGEHDVKERSRRLTRAPIPRISDWKHNGLNAISLFSGAFGLDLGFMASGYNLRLANDIDKDSKAVAAENIPQVDFILEDIKEVSSSEILRRASLGKREVDVLIGGPPCQPFSTAGKRQGLNDPRSSPLKEFVRVINELSPKAFVMEEVTGLLSSRLTHVSVEKQLTKRLTKEEQKGSLFEQVLSMLGETGYNVEKMILNAADYGSPQVRRRVIIVGLRKGQPSFPVPTHTNRFFLNLFAKGFHPWVSLWEAVADLQTGGNWLDFSDRRASYLKLVPPGGYWRHLPSEEIQAAMGGAYFSGGGKMGFYRRLLWDEPSPTVVTSPLQKGTEFCHPVELRPLSVEEYRRVQGFPDDWVIPGTVSTAYRLIGNAVPVHLSFAIAEHVKTILVGKKK